MSWSWQLSNKKSLCYSPELSLLSDQWCPGGFLGGDLDTHIIMGSGYFSVLGRDVDFTEGLFPCKFLLKLINQSAFLKVSFYHQPLGVWWRQGDHQIPRHRQISYPVICTGTETSYDLSTINASIWLISSYSSSSLSLYQ